METTEKTEDGSLITKKDLQRLEDKITVMSDFLNSVILRHARRMNRIEMRIDTIENKS